MQNTLSLLCSWLWCQAVVTWKRLPSCLTEIDRLSRGETSCESFLSGKHTALVLENQRILTRPLSQAVEQSTWTQVVWIHLKGTFPSCFSTLKCIRLTALCSCDCPKSGSFIPAEKLLAALEGSGTHGLNHVGDVAPQQGHWWISACSELCPFASFSSCHILCKARLALHWQEEVGCLLLSNV